MSVRFEARSHRSGEFHEYYYAFKGAKNTKVIQSKSIISDTTRPTISLSGMSKQKDGRYLVTATVSEDAVGFTVVPLLLPGAPDPREVTQFWTTLRWIDMRDGVEANLDSLVSAVRGAPV